MRDKPLTELGSLSSFFDRQDVSVIVGFFSLAPSILHIPELDNNDNKLLSVNKRKNIDGYRGKDNGIVKTDFPVYLIGQLARSNRCSSDTLTGQTLLDAATGIILDAISLVGGRLILVECIPELIPFYEKHGFVIRCLDTGQEGEYLTKMIKQVTPYICDLH